MAAAAESLGLPRIDSDYLEEERHAHGLLPPWPLVSEAAGGGGGTPATLLMGCFAAEGDNVPHAMQLAAAAVALLGRLGDDGAAAAPQLRVPCSFAALYGRTTGVDAFLG